MTRKSTPPPAAPDDMDDNIPTLTEIIAPNKPLLPHDQMLALQAELSVRVLNLAEELLHGAAREMQAVLLERVCDQLRAQLPELIDEALRERLQVFDLDE